METRVVVCTNCGQDWIKKYIILPTGKTFYKCPECEWVWSRLPESGAKNPSKEEDELLAMEVEGYGRDQIRSFDD